MFFSPTLALTLQGNRTTTLILPKLCPLVTWVIQVFCRRPQKEEKDQVWVKHLDPNPCLQAEVKMSSWISDLLEGEAQKQPQQGSKGSPGTLYKEWSEVSMKKSCCGCRKQPGEGLHCQSTGLVCTFCFASMWRSFPASPCSHLLCAGSSVESSAFIFSFVQQLGNGGGGCSQEENF